ncbi:MAG: WD40/YVTN/BNR-like repeat-containing protein, partial [Solirubrobacteraceae bacterium]
MELQHASVWPRAGERFAATVRVATVVAGTGVVAFLLFAAPSRGAGPVVPFRIVLTNAAFATLAVDHRGVAYGVAETGATSLYRLYSSTDEGQTWTAVADFPSCSRVTDLSVLSDDTLLAHVNNCANVAIYRSADHGATWKSVFTFPQPDDYRTLTPHSITDDGHAVYIGSYNTLDSSNHENWVWRSLDDGQTWQVVLDTTTHRHIHFVQADPTTHWVYVGYGDEGVGEIDVTRDQGATWSPLCTGDQCLAVDIAFDPSGFAIFGQDLPYGSDNIQRVNLATGAVSTIMPLHGISYSSMRLPGGVWLIGTTHGPGTAYVPGDLDVHLFASIDNGQTFSDVYDTPYDPNDCCYALKVQFAYPNGDFPIQVGGGTVVAHIDTSSSSPPANTSLPAISGSAVVGQLLSASTGVWSGSPSGYAYEWRRCDTTGAGCVAIGGATSAGYTLTLADVGATLRVAVTASNGGGSATAVSTQTAVVAAAPTGGSFGQSLVGTLVDSGGAGYLDLSGPYAVSAAVSVSQLNGYMAGSSTASRLRGVIYTNSGG